MIVISDSGKHYGFNVDQDGLTGEWDANVYDSNGKTVFESDGYADKASALLAVIQLIESL